MFTRILTLLSVLFYAAVAQAQGGCPGACFIMAYEGFQYPANAPLHAQVGGSGWSQGWDVQGNNTDVPGYQTTGTGLTYSDLQTSGTAASGSRSYLTAGRMIDVSAGGPFASFLSNDGIGLAGRDLYVAALLSKDQNNNEEVWLGLHRSNIPWYFHQNRVAMGYFGSHSDNGGTRYWTLRVEDNYYQTTVPVSIGTTSLLVMKIAFGANNQHTISLYVNPADLGDTEPAPTLVQAVQTPLSLTAMAFYAGSSAGNGRLDEIRMAASYRCATPDADVFVNQLPVASFTSSAADGNAPFQVQFNSSASSDDDGTISSRQWQFGDGGSSSAINPTYTFQNPGYYQVTLTVTDNCGDQSGSAQWIVVRDADGQFPCGSAVALSSPASPGQNNGGISCNSSYGSQFQLTGSGGLNISQSSGQFNNLSAGSYTLTVSGANGCQDVFSLQVFTDATQQPGWIPNLCDLQLGVNLDGTPYWNKIRPFKNLKLESGEFFSADASGGPWNSGVMSQIPVDANGYPTQLPYTTSRGASIVRCVISADGHLPPGQYVLLYDGAGSISMQGSVTVSSNTPGRIAFQLFGEGNQWFHITSSQSGNHIRNIRILRAAHETDDLSDPFYDVFLEKVNRFTTLRFMDWGHTNGSELSEWSQRTDPDHHTMGEGDGVAYEWMIALANRLQKDVWICVPHQASENYITQMATLFRNQLHAGANIYLEYSNEVWNWQFSQAHWVNDNGPAHLSHPQKYAYFSKRVFDIWTQVFGAQSDRVKRVLGTQAVNPWISQQMMAYIKDGFDFLSPTWYFGYSGSACEGSIVTPQDVLDCSISNWRTAASAFRQQYRDAKMYGKGVVEYEGGQHMTSNPATVPFQQAVYDAQIDPNIALLYNEVLDSLRRWGSSLAMAFTLASVRESIYGSWGALEDINHDGSNPPAPKWSVLNSNIHCYTPPVTVNPVLAVEWVAFEGREDGCSVVLNWQTGAETNASHFEVQRSFDGRHFTTIGRLAARGQASAYSFTDREIGSAKAYYRIAENDFDGRKSYSVIRHLNGRCPSVFSLHPNPAGDFITLTLSENVPHSTREVWLFDAQGRLLRKEVWPSGDRHELSIEDLPAGLYWLGLYDGRGHVSRQRLVKF